MKTHHSRRTCSFSFVQVVLFASWASKAALPFVCRSLTASAAQSADRKDTETRRAYSPWRVMARTMINTKERPDRSYSMQHNRINFVAGARSQLILCDSTCKSTWQWTTGAYASGAAVRTTLADGIDETVIKKASRARGRHT